MSEQGKEQNSGSVFEGPIYGPVHAGSGDVHIDEIHYGLEDYDVKPGEQYTGNISRQNIESLRKPIRIGTGTQKNPTVVKGSLAGHHIETGDYILIEGSICGLEKISVGKSNYIQGSVIGDYINAEENFNVHGNILARQLTLKAGANIKGHMICENILDSSGHSAAVLAPIKLGGLLVCNQSLVLTTECQLSGIISTGDVRLESNCHINSVLAKGMVYLPENCYVPHVECGRLVTSSKVSVAVACIKESVDLGENTEIGFLYCAGDILNISEGVRLGNSTLLSWRRHPTIHSQFLLGAQTYSKADALGITSQRDVVGTPEISPGVIYTKWINGNLLSVISALTKEPLHLRTKTE